MTELKIPGSKLIIVKFHSFVCSLFRRKEEILAMSAFNLDTYKLGILIIRVILSYVVKSKSKCKWNDLIMEYFDILSIFWKLWSLPFTLNKLLKFFIRHNLIR